MLEAKIQKLKKQLIPFMRKEAAKKEVAEKEGEGGGQEGGDRERR
jgi:hypothetical protein